MQPRHHYDQPWLPLLPFGEPSTFIHHHYYIIVRPYYHQLSLDQSSIIICALFLYWYDSVAKRNTSASVWANAESCSLSLHVQAVDVPKQWMSPTAERVWHRMKRLKDTEMRLWAEVREANQPLHHLHHGPIHV